MWLWLCKCTLSKLDLFLEQRLLSIHLQLIYERVRHSLQKFETAHVLDGLKNIVGF